MRTLITLVVVLFCLQLWAQAPDTTRVAPGRLIIQDYHELVVSGFGYLVAL